MTPPFSLLHKTTIVVFTLNNAKLTTKQKQGWLRLGLTKPIFSKFIIRRSSFFPKFKICNFLQVLKYPNFGKCPTRKIPAVKNLQNNESSSYYKFNFILKNRNYLHFISYSYFFLSFSSLFNSTILLMFQLCKKNLEGKGFFVKAGKPFCKSHARMGI